MYNISNSKYLKTPASEEKIAKVKGKQSIPNCILELWMLTNGIMNNNTGINIYSTEDILERNETMEVVEYDNTVFLIGNDSGGTGIFLNIETENCLNVYELGFGAIGSMEPRKISDNIYDWINNNFQE